MAGRYDLESNLVFVAMITEGKTTAKYAFRTTIESTTGTVLGHTAATGKNNDLVAGVILGANSPKPFRASSEQGGTRRSESSFIANNKIGTAKAAGWTITAPKYRSAPISGRSKLVFVGTKVGATVINYGWAMPNYQYEKISAELATLGITEIDTKSDIAETKAFFGVNVPRPGRASKEIAGGTAGSGGGLLTTFVSDTKADDAIAAGWRVRAKQTVQKGYLVPNS